MVLAARHSMLEASATTVPSDAYMQKVYWIFVLVAVGIAGTVNIFNLALFRQRLAAHAKGLKAPAKPRNIILRSQAAMAAVVREITYYSWKPFIFGNISIYFSPFGPCIIVGANLVLLIACWFYALDPEDQGNWERIGYRTGFIACAQIPLVVVLSGKRNLLGAITGCGYERLNWLHRWLARCLFLTVLVHMGFWFADWDRFRYIGVKVSTDSITQRGIAAGALLAWMILSSPFRRLFYEFFIAQHIIFFLGFLTLVYFHVPAENKKWVKIAFALWAVDRILRAGFLLYNNLAIFHRNKKGALTCLATFEAVDKSHTRVIILNAPITWKAGQHIFLSCHGITSHPFTIVSLPSDGHLEFLIRAKKGSTKKFLKYAAVEHPISADYPHKKGRGVLVEGPYSAIRPLRQFDSVVFVAGSTGITFTIPLMRDIIRQWMMVAGLCPEDNRGEDLLSKVIPAPIGAVTRSIQFVWAVKKSKNIKWFLYALNDAMSDVARLRGQCRDVHLEINLYITSEEPLSTQVDATNSFGCFYTPSYSPPNTDSASETKTFPNSSSSASHNTDGLDRRIVVHYGRPELMTIIRQEAELALGEMAVVVCGPPGMVRSARNAASYLSNDRAVHKGTGAQGIYVHAEMFGY